MKRRLKRIISITLLCMLLGTCFSAAVAEGAEEPESYARQCVYENANERKIYYSTLYDDDPETCYGTRIVLEPEEWISVKWEDAKVDFVYFEWTDKGGSEPAPYTIELLNADGEVLESREGEPYWNNGVRIGEDVFGVRLIPHEQAELCTLIPYAGGAPKDYHPWKPTAEKADFLVVAMHPDDDALFMGNIIATYGAERGMNGTVLYMGTRERIRRTEALNGAWIMGQRTYPLMAGLPDIPMSYRKEYKNDFLPEDVALVLVRYLRRIRPEIVISHDDQGEYGHWQHIVLAQAIRRAVIDAADADIDPESAAQYGVWQVKKLYLHLAKENPIFISATEPLAAFDGRTGWEVAQEAYQCHQSQLLWNHVCNNQDENSLERFGLVYTTVGVDTGVNDMFEHIDPASVSGVILSAAGTEEPTAEPTATPEEPTPQATEAQSEQPTPAQTPVAEPEPPQTENDEGNGRTAGIVLAAALMLAALGTTAAAIVMKKKDPAGTKGHKTQIALLIAAAALLLCGAGVLIFTLLSKPAEPQPADETAAAEPTPEILLTVNAPADVRKLAEIDTIRTVEVAQGALTNEEIEQLLAAYPDISFTYSVRIGGRYVPSDADTLTREDGETAESVCAVIPLLPNLRSVALGACTPKEISAAKELSVSPEITYQVLLYGQQIEPSAAQIDLSGAEAPDPQELVEALPYLPQLRSVELGGSADPDTVAAFLHADTGLAFHYAYSFEYLGRTLTESTETLDLSGERITDLDALKEVFSRLPALKRAEMIDCGIEDEEMAALRDAFPEIKIVWEISLGYWGKLRTDATAYTTRSSKRPDEMKNRLTTETIQPLQYCTDLVALDLGHQQIEDISCLKTLTKLQILILADNKISDLTALVSMPDLVYVELFMNRISDLTPLSGLKNIKDLNLCTNRISDLTPLYPLASLERLWYSNNKYTKADHDALQAQLPNCICNRTVWQETDDGWREHERYFWMRSFFADSPRYR